MCKGMGSEWGESLNQPAAHHVSGGFHAAAITKLRHGRQVADPDAVAQITQPTITNQDIQGTKDSVLFNFLDSDLRSWHDVDGQPFLDWRQDRKTTICAFLSLLHHAESIVPNRNDSPRSFARSVALFRWDVTEETGGFAHLGFERPKWWTNCDLTQEPKMGIATGCWLFLRNSCWSDTGSKEKGALDMLCLMRAHPP